MKNSIFWMMMIGIFLFIACRKENNDNKKTGVTIKGKISESRSLKIQESNTTESLSLADAKKVLLFAGGVKADMKFVDIIDGSFTAWPNAGTATALVFLNGNNQYIGTLSTRGLDLLPLGTLENGDTTTIDLSTLTLAGTNVIPTHDPFGHEIIITDAEINGFKELDGFFESIAKNIDADNDGVLDVLSNKQMYIISSFAIVAGTYGVDSKQAVINDSASSTINYSSWINGDLGFTTPAKSSMSGPEGSPYDTIRGGYIQSFDNEGHGFTTGFNVGTAPFKKGIYDLTLDDKKYTLSFSNIDAKYNLVFVTPTIHTNSDGKLTSISLIYQHSDHTIVNPENILTDVMIQLTDSVGHQFYNSPWLNRSGMCPEGSGTNCVDGLNSLTINTPLDISTLKHIDAVYHDILGNLYFIHWQ